MNWILGIFAIALTLFGGVDSSNNTQNLEVDIVNSEANFIYYYGKTCSHCIQLHAELVWRDIYSKEILETREVWDNQKNLEEFQELTESLGILPEMRAVPFLYDKSSKEHFIWISNIVPILEAAITEMWGAK